MGIDDEQCPSRGPGLKHAFDDGRTCDECGVVKPVAGLTLADWIRSIRATPPRKVELSGEKAEDRPASKDEEPALGAFPILREHEWHMAEVERFWRDTKEPDAANRRAEPDPDYPLPKD